MLKRLNQNNLVKRRKKNQGDFNFVFMFWIESGEETVTDATQNAYKKFWDRIFEKSAGEKLCQVGRFEPLYVRPAVTNYWEVFDIVHSTFVEISSFFFGEKSVASAILEMLWPVA